jgi:hypothetical protein
MSLQRLAQDHQVLVADGVSSKVQIHQTLVVGECPEQDSDISIICPIKIWLEPGHTTVARQSVGDNLTVNFAYVKLNWTSTALKALDKGTCCIIR